MPCSAFDMSIPCTANQQQTESITQDNKKTVKRVLYIKHMAIEAVNLWHHHLLLNVQLSMIVHEQAHGRPQALA